MNASDLSWAWLNVVRFINEPVTMPDVAAVPVAVRGRTYPRYKAPHVPSQDVCGQLPSILPGDVVNQEVYGCNASCTNGCVAGLPSLHNPGPSLANTSFTVNLMRVHKAGVHFSCVRALVILQADTTDSADQSRQLLRHKFGLARLLMKPMPGHAYRQKTDFVENIITGNYSRNATGVWQMWQTGTLGLRSMNVSSDSPSYVTYKGVTDLEAVRLPGQMDCWLNAC